MAVRLAHYLAKLPDIPNQTNAKLIKEILDFMDSNDTSETHRLNLAKVLVPYGHYLGKKNFLEVKERGEVISYLDTKKKSKDQDPDERWITTWNHHLSRVKFLFRWLHNQYDKSQNFPMSEWETPEFVRIKKKRTKRLSPYSESEIWDKDELLAIVKYEPHMRNKAAIAMAWDLDARPHEITLIKIKDIVLKERYGEGRISHEAKTGSGPVLLMVSFPYVKEWLKVHPLKNTGEARLICNLKTGAPMHPDNMWDIMMNLKARIARMIDAGTIKDPVERERLQFFLRTKKFNPYCLRHSAITYDSDFLPGYALNKKVRWSLNSKQPSRYIKTRMGNDLKRQLLAREGIIDPEVREKPSVRICPNCNAVSALEYEYCVECRYPLTPTAMEHVKKEETRQIEEMVERKIQEMLGRVELSRLG